MTLAQLEHTAALYEKLKKLATNTRHYWIAYSRSRASSDKAKALRYQRELDNFLNQEIKKEKQQQKEIF